MNPATTILRMVPKAREAWPRIKAALPATTSRVPRQSAAFENRRIREGIENRVRYYADHPDEIDARLAELDREWDTERVLEAVSATAVITGVGLSLRNRRFLALPGVVSAFLLQHAVQGWCPPLPLIRRLGVRTQPEIEAERQSLQSLRHAFSDLEQRQRGSLPGSLKELASQSGTS